MKQFKIPLILILACLLLLTACTGNALFDCGPLKMTSQSDSAHFFHSKELPNGFFLKPLSDVELKSRAAFLIDADRDRVLFDKNSHESLGVASMSKIKIGRAS